MSRHIKTFMLLFAVSLLLPAVGVAKVYPVLKYQQQYQENNFEICIDPNTGKKYNCKNKNHSSKELEVGCETRGFFEVGKEPANATCTTVKVGEKDCRKCHCEDIYQYRCASVDKNGKVTSITGIVPQKGDGGCRIDKKDAMFYKECKCDIANGYIPSDYLNLPAYGTFGTGSPVSVSGGNGGQTVTCYLVSSFSGVCPNGKDVIPNSKVSTTSGTASAVSITTTDEKGVTYTAKALLNTKEKSLTVTENGVKGVFNNKYCASNATFSHPLMTSAPTDDCVNFSSQQTRYYAKTYYYYTGCKTEGLCQTSSNDCVLSSDTPITVYIPLVEKNQTADITCYKMTGCKNGMVETSNGTQIFCKEVPSINYAAAGFNINSTQVNTTAGTKVCARISCNTANKWEQPYSKITDYSASTDYTTYNTSTSTHYRYDAKKQTAGSHTLVCRQPDGCLSGSGWYNFACAKATGSDVSFPNGEKNELCWDGWLSLWAKVAGK